MRILATYGWCRTAYIAAESLCRAGFEVYACGSTALSMVRVSRFVRGFDRVPDPFKEPEQYLTEISAIVKRRNIDVLLPVHEDALAIQTYRELLPEPFTFAWVAQLFLPNRGPAKTAKFSNSTSFALRTSDRDAKGNLLPDLQRITAIGQFLRKTRLEEFPQLGNVIDVSLSTRKTCISFPVASE